MNTHNLHPKLGVLSTIVIGTVLTISFHTVAMANPAESYGHWYKY